MGQPARKEQEETYSTAASNLTQERMAGKLGLAGGGEGVGLYPRHMRVILFFEGMIYAVINTRQFANCILQ